MRPIWTPVTQGVYGAPPGHDADIDGLPYWRVANEFGGVTVYSAWTFTEAERAAIAAGANLLLGILGEPIPPVILAIGRAEGALAESRPADDQEAPA